MQLALLVTFLSWRLHPWDSKRWRCDAARLNLLAAPPARCNWPWRLGRARPPLPPPTLHKPPLSPPTASPEPLQSRWGGRRINSLEQHCNLEAGQITSTKIPKLTSKISTSLTSFTSFTIFTSLTVFNSSTIFTSVTILRSDAKFWGRTLNSEVEH